MKTSILKTLTLLMLLSVGIGILPASGAKRTFNASNDQLYIIEKDGVVVTLYDRRWSTGHDQSGKLMFDNTSNVPVKLEYQVYGITEKGAKTLVDKGSKELRAKEKPSYGLSYSYGPDYKINGKWKYKEYAVAIKIVKLNVKDDPKAKRTRNSSNDELYIITKDGVTATLYDRRESTGHDHSGKIMLENSNKTPVKIEYQVYGIDREGGKHLVHKDSQSLEAGQKPSWGFTYSYGDEHSGDKNRRKYEKYGLAIKVSGISSQYTKSADKNYDILYSKVKNNQTLTQEDYVMAIKISEVYADNIMSACKSIGKSPWELTTAEQNKLYSKLKKESDRLQWLGDLIENAYRSGKFSSDTERYYKQLLSKYGEG